jgi:hypothetical protein
MKPEVKYELEANAYVVLDYHTDTADYAKKVREILKENPPFEGVKQDICILIEDDNKAHERSVTFKIDYDLTDTNPRFHLLDGEKVIEKMSRAVTNAFVKAGYERFDYEETYYSYETDETLHNKYGYDYDR